MCGRNYGLCIFSLMGSFGPSKAVASFQHNAQPYKDLLLDNILQMQCNARYYTCSQSRTVSFLKFVYLGSTDIQYHPKWRYCQKMDYWGRNFYLRNRPSPPPYTSSAYVCQTSICRLEQHRFNVRHTFELFPCRLLICPSDMPIK